MKSELPDRRCPTHRLPQFNLRGRTRMTVLQQVEPSVVRPARAKAITTAREWAEMIKIEHTVFALPFALSGLLLGAPHLPSPLVVLYTVIAFAGARSAAMTLNRVIDARIDSRNPRTAARAIPAGRISPTQAMLFAIGSFAVMLLAASQLPPICLWLSPIAIIWLSFYSYTKRFTWLCHIVLGIALGGAALGGWVAAGGSLATISPWLLAIAVSTWVAGFDIIYALQDLNFDKVEKLHSIPAKFGIRQALESSLILHIGTIACLVALGISMELGIAYWIGVAVVSSMLAYEHNLLSPGDLTKLDAAFFNVNGIISILAFVSILLDRIGVIK